ncbi:DUF3313 domain-containing protein [Sphingomonas sp. PL-96]|uniref:DUF3313 family protein n=1 Tax=Sphingomonas sp. PL-96 TaxID=2887201 RepID=UPI001E4A4B55|nr:DUF3313 family protein [Sphingomonas sp. PL-96]MCC2978235.1 DUF3313 domain-containing protein [Sphingomonas sp. PL-96]
MNRNLAAIALVACALAGCSTGGQKLTRSGFIGEQQPLQRAGKHKNAAFWVAPTYDGATYRRVVVAPVEWHAPPRDAAVQERLKRQFRDALTERLAGRYRIVEAREADASTLRVRAAITNVRRTRWYINAPAQVASSLTFGTVSLFAPLQGGASEEIQVEDARTGAVLAQLAAYRNGKPWNVKGSYVAYDHARMAFAEAARRLDEVLAGSIVADRPVER